MSGRVKITVVVIVACFLLVGILRRHRPDSISSKIGDSFKDQKISELESVILEKDRLIARSKDKVKIIKTIPDGYFKIDFNKQRKLQKELVELRKEKEILKRLYEIEKNKNKKVNKSKETGFSGQSNISKIVGRINKKSKEINDKEKNIYTLTYIEEVRRGFSFRPTIIGGFVNKKLSYGLGLKLYYWNYNTLNIGFTPEMVGLGYGLNLGIITNLLSNTQLLGMVGLGNELKFKTFIGLSIGL